MWNVPEITIEDAKKKLGKTLFVDIRDAGSFASGHIPGAKQLNDETIQDFLKKTKKDTDIIVYCYHGNSSKGATHFLLEQGFMSVHSMSGGFEQWRNENGSVE